MDDIEILEEANELVVSAAREKALRSDVSVSYAVARSVLLGFATISTDESSPTSKNQDESSTGTLPKASVVKPFIFLIPRCDVKAADDGDAVVLRASFVLPTVA